METKTLLEPSLEKQLKGHKNTITALYYSPNEQQIATSSLDNSVLLWDLRGYMRSYRFQGHDEAVTDVTFSPSGKYMASASRDKTVRLWVPTVTGSTGMFKAHSQTVRSVQFTSDGTKILTASDDKIVKLWSSEKHKFLASFVGHTNWVRSARMSTDCSVIASCSDDKTVRLWNPNSGECIHTYKDQKGHGLCLAWHPSGCYIAVGTSQGNVKLYDIRTHDLVQYYSIHNDAINKLDFHPSGSYIITCSKDGRMKILDLLEGHPIFTLCGHSGPVNAVGFSPNGDTFASAGDDKLVFIWKTNFTEVQNDENENVTQHPATVVCPARSAQKSQTKTLASTKGAKMWSKCYHSFIFPVTEFVNVECNNTSSANTSTRLPSLREDPPLANSTLLDTSMPHMSGSAIQSCINFVPRNPDESAESDNQSCQRNSGNCNTGGCPRNTEVLNNDASCSGNFPNNSNDCNTSYLRNPDDVSKECNPDSCSKIMNCNRNSCPRTSVIVSNECNADHCPKNSNVSSESLHNSHPRSFSRCSGTYCLNEDPSVNVGHMSHIPRTPPTPTTYTVPTLGKNISSTCETGGTIEGRQKMSSSTRATLKTNLSFGNSQMPNMGTSTAGRTTCRQDNSLFGMIALKENDVCYTSGTIEWVGRKRSYPLNTGFKVLRDNCNNCSRGNEPKKKRKSDATFTVGMDSTRECDCTDMLPTVNAIVDHLNALHEAVDLVDLRLSNLEETL